MALNSSVANKCGFLRQEDGVKEIFLDYHMDKLQEPRVPAFIYREILPTKKHLPFSISNLREECYGSNMCLDKQYLQGKMEQYYPTITIYQCTIDYNTGATTLLNLTD